MYSVAVWLNALLCDQRIMILKTGDTIVISVVSHVYKIGLDLKYHLLCS